MKRLYEIATLAALFTISSICVAQDTQEGSSGGFSPPGVHLPWNGYMVDRIPNAWVSIIGRPGTVIIPASINRPPGAVIPVILPDSMSVKYMGTTYTAFNPIRLLINGAISFDNTATTPTYSLEPWVGADTTVRHTRMVAPYWGGLTSLGVFGGGIYIRVDGSSPSRVLTVEWFVRDASNASSTPGNFQAKMYEGSGKIEFFYGPNSINKTKPGKGVSGEGSFIGLKNLGQPVGLPYGNDAEKYLLLLDPDAVPDTVAITSLRTFTDSSGQEYIPEYAATSMSIMKPVFDFRASPYFQYRFPTQNGTPIGYRFTAPVNDVAADSVWITRDTGFTVHARFRNIGKVAVQNVPVSLSISGYPLPDSIMMGVAFPTPAPQDSTYTVTFNNAITIPAVDHVDLRRIRVSANMTSPIDENRSNDFREIGIGYVFGFEHISSGTARLLAGESGYGFLVVGAGAGLNNAITINTASANEFRWSVEATDLPSHGEFVTQLRGMVGGNEKVIALSRYQYDSSGWVLRTPDFSGAGASTSTVLFYHGDSQVRQMTQASGIVGTMARGFSTFACGCIQSSVYCEGSDLSGINITLADGTVINEVTRVRFVAEQAATPAQYTTSISLGTVGIPDYLITKEALVAFGHEHSGHMYGRFIPTPGGVRVGNIDSSGSDGMVIDLGGPSLSWKGVPDSVNLLSMTPGSFLKVTTMRMVDDMDNQPIGSTTYLRTANGIKVTPDFASPGSHTQTIQVFNNGKIVAIARRHSGTAVEIPIMPLNINVWSHRFLLHWSSDVFTFPAPVKIRITGGREVTGDEVRIMAEQPVAENTWPNKVLVQSSNIPISFTNEWVTPADRTLGEEQNLALDYFYAHNPLTGNEERFTREDIEAIVNVLKEFTLTRGADTADATLQTTRLLVELQDESVPMFYLENGTTYFGSHKPSDSLLPITAQRLRTTGWITDALVSRLSKVNDTTLAGDALATIQEHIKGEFIHGLPDALDQMNASAFGDVHIHSADFWSSRGPAQKIPKWVKDDAQGALVGLPLGWVGAVVGAALNSIAGVEATVARPSGNVNFNGLNHQQLGAANVDLTGGRLLARNYGPGPSLPGDSAGMRVTVALHITFRAEVEPVILRTPDAGITITGRGRADGRANSPLGSAYIRNAGDGELEVGADFNALGPKSVVIAICTGDSLLRLDTLPAGMVARLSDDATIIRFEKVWFSDRFGGYSIRFDGEHSITVPSKPPLEADEIILLAADSVKTVGKISSFDMRMTGIDSLTIIRDMSSMDTTRRDRISSVPIARGEDASMVLRATQTFARDEIAITYHLNRPGDTRLWLYNLEGREVAAIELTDQEGGDHITRFNITGLPSGLYMVRIISGTAFASCRVIVMH